MTQPAKAQEPSMEEILASIRRIIADDDASKPPPLKAPESPPAPARRPAAPTPPAPPPRPASAPRPGAEPVMKQNDLDSTPSDVDASAPAAEKSAPGVLDLSEPKATSTPSVADSFRKIDPRSDRAFQDASDEPPAPKSQPQPQGPPERRLMSSSTSAAVDSAFNTLAQTVLVQNARTLEDLVKEMLRPLLKTWLDENLPGLVERLVRAEIERVSRGRS